MASQPSPGSVDRFFERFHGWNAATLATASVTLGLRLGLYRALDRLGTADSERLASATETAERYVREWLAHQAVCGVLEVAEAGEARTRQYRIPPGHRAVLVDGDDPRYLLSATRFYVGLAASLDAVVGAFRSGEGLPLGAYHDDVAAAGAAMNRPVYVGLLADRWIPAIPDLHDRLGADPPARITDIGCGSGWALISLAKAYPRLEAQGIDLDRASVEAARENAAAEGVSDRVTFEVRDVTDLELQGRYDLVTLFESLHHFPDPAGALRTLRGLLRDDGIVLLTEMRCAETFTAPGDTRERLLYGFSVLNCLPKSLAAPDAEAPGAVLRPAQVERYGLDAGYSTVEPLDLDPAGSVWRFYRLTP